MMFTSPAVREGRDGGNSSGRQTPSTTPMNFELVGGCAPYILRSEYEPVSPSKTKIEMPALLIRKGKPASSARSSKQNLIGEAHLARIDKRQQRLNSRLSASMDGAQAQALERAIASQKRINHTVSAAKEKRQVETLNRLRRSTSTKDMSQQPRRRVSRSSPTTPVSAAAQALRNENAMEAARRRVALQKKLNAKRIYPSSEGGNKPAPPPQRVVRSPMANEDGVKAARQRIRDASKAQADALRREQEQKERKAKLNETQIKEQRRQAVLRVKEHREEQAFLIKQKELEANKAQSERKALAENARQLAERKRVLVYALNGVHQHFKQVQFEQYMKELAEKRANGESYLDSSSGSDSDNSDAAAPSSSLQDVALPTSAPAIDSTEHQQQPPATEDPSFPSV